MEDTVKKVLYVNVRKPKAMLSNTTFKEEKVYQAHTEKQAGLEAYIHMSEYEKLKIKLGMVESVK